MTPPLADTLDMVAQAAGEAKDAWWIIGSAAVTLHGATVTDLRDVDLMMSPEDADLLLRRVRGQRQPVAASDPGRKSLALGTSRRFLSKYSKASESPPIKVG